MVVEGGSKVEVCEKYKCRYGKYTYERYKAGPQAGVVYYNCLVTVQYDPDVHSYPSDGEHAWPKHWLKGQPEPRSARRCEVYLATRMGVKGDAAHPDSVPTQWRGDGFVTKAGDESWVPMDEDSGRALKQTRTLRQSRLFITYSLHRPVTSERLGQVILSRMADAIYTLFGSDKWLSEMIVFGKYLKSFNVGRQKADNVSQMMWSIIDKTKKADAMEGFYGFSDNRAPRTSYIYDTYETHIDKLEIDAGCEIGPKMGHPHFHLLLTMNHFSYVHFDYFKMNTFLEIMFRGINTFHGWGNRYELPDNFYGDNENPYVDVKLYPQDNWKEILAAYVRKSAIPSIVEVEAGRRVWGNAEERRAFFSKSQSTQDNGGAQG